MARQGTTFPSVHAAHDAARGALDAGLTASQARDAAALRPSTSENTSRASQEFCYRADAKSLGIFRSEGGAGIVAPLYTGEADVVEVHGNTPDEDRTYGYAAMLTGRALASDFYRRPDGPVRWLERNSQHVDVERTDPRLVEVLGVGTDVTFPDGASVARVQSLANPGA